MCAELNKDIRLARYLSKPLQLVLLAFAGSLPVSSFAACPDLSIFYQSEGGDSAVLKQISELLPECLESSEFFAVYGAAQLNGSDLEGALESLERALLLNPENGAAAIDYSQALFEVGQLFTALEMNQRLIGRQDLPEGLLRLVHGDRTRCCRGQRTSVRRRRRSGDTDWSRASG